MDYDSYIEATSGLVGLSIEASWMPGVARYLDLAAEMAALLETIELDDAELVLAPVFTPTDLGDTDA